MRSQVGVPDWYQQEAARDGIVITSAQVAQAFAADKRQQFPTAAAYRTFLRLTGQTNTDARFRVRANLTYEALIKQAGGHRQVVNQRARKLFGPSTICARYYVMADCAGYRPGAGAA